MVKKIIKNLVQRIKESVTTRRVARAIAIAPFAVPAAQALAEEQTKPKYNIEAETEYNAETKNLTSRLELSRGIYPIARLERQEGDISKNLYGAKVLLDSKIINGYIDAFGLSDSEDNWGGGINFDTTLARKLILGGAAEKAQENGIEKRVLNVYSGLDLQRTRFSFGVADFREGEDNKTIYHGVFFQDFPKNYIIGLGGLIDNEENKYVHFVGGHYPEQIRKGFGWRVWGLSEFEGDVLLDCILSLDSTFSKASYVCGFDQYTDFHELKFRATENVMDYFRPWVPLHQRTNKVSAIEAKLEHNEGENNIILDTALFPVGLLGKLGIDARNYLPNSLWIGPGFETEDNRFVAKAGIKLSKLEIYGVKREGQKPCFLVGYYTEF